MDPTRRRALTLLLEGHSARAVSRELLVAPSTVTRWMHNDPDFKEALGQEEASQATEGLERLVPEALKVLEQALDSSKNIPLAKARVALDIIKASAAILKSSDEGQGSGLAKRLAEIDAGNNGRTKSNDLAVPD